ncbi:MAG: tetratricopeptide repeat protein [Acidobacteriota bacterium]
MNRLNSFIRPAAVVAWLVASVVLPIAAHEGVHEQIAVATSQIKREPKNASLYLKRGELYRLHREWNAALADYRLAQQLNPHLEEVNFARARMYYDAGKPEKAIGQLDRFLAVRPVHVDALVTRARVLVKLGQRVAAAKDYSVAIAQLAKPKPEYYIERAQALRDEGSKHHDEALSGIDEGIKKLGPIVTLQLFAIELELAGKRHDAALSRLEQIAAQSPRKELWLARRGEIMLAAGRLNDARQAFAKALTAIESLPPRHRMTKATLELETRVRAAIGAQ